MVGLRFHEVMLGRITPQSTSTDGGYRADGAVAAALLARIDIADLDLFLDRDLPHVGELSVELRIPVLSSRPFVGHRGKFELFQPVGATGYRMVYEATVTDLDRTYTMKGYKYLRPRRLWGFWRLWPETTTLHVTLEDITPRDDSAPADVDVEMPVDGEVPDWLTKIRAATAYEPWAQRDFHRPEVACGIVRISLSHFVQQLLSMTPVDTPWYGKPFAVGRFMAFFAWSLVRIYVFGQHRDPR